MFQHNLSYSTGGYLYKSSFFGIFHGTNQGGLPRDILSETRPATQKKWLSAPETVWVSPSVSRAERGICRALTWIRWVTWPKRTGPQNLWCTYYVILGISCYYYWYYYCYYDWYS